MELDRVYLDTAARTLEQLSGRIVTCLEKLSHEQIWFRAGDHENAVGNLVLHLCGNVRQWIGHGAGQLPNVRDRDSEFAARGEMDRGTLIARLNETIAIAQDVLRSGNAEMLARRARIQGYDVPVLEAVFHSVQHFAQHTGQILFITKNLTREDLGFYRHLSQPRHDQKTP
ncbi:MAG: DUF1572 domain-containing protein [Acidobacteria bacterium]|nr:DUF1572 domain-containing protein [Acidobacteriota bacterium]